MVCSGTGTGLECEAGKEAGPGPWSGTRLEKKTLHTVYKSWLLSWRQCGAIRTLSYSREDRPGVPPPPWATDRLGTGPHSRWAAGERAKLPLLLPHRLLLPELSRAPLTVPVPKRLETAGIDRRKGRRGRERSSLLKMERFASGPPKKNVLLYFILA